MEKQRMFKNVVIGVLLIAVVSLSIAFSAFSASLNINGQATIKSAASSWNVKFTSINAINTTGYAVGTPTSSSTSSQEAVTFTCDLYAPGDECTLSGTIANTGSVKALFSGAKLTVSGTDATDNTFSDADVTVTLTKPATWTSGTTVLAKDDSGNFSLTVKAKDDATFAAAKTYTIVATFNFDQAENA